MALCVDFLSAHPCRTKSSPFPALPRAELGWLGWLPEASWRKKVEGSWVQKKKSAKYGPQASLGHIAF